MQLLNQMSNYDTYLICSSVCVQYNNTSMLNHPLPMNQPIQLLGILQVKYRQNEMGEHIYLCMVILFASSHPHLHTGKDR